MGEAVSEAIFRSVYTPVVGWEKPPQGIVHNDVSDVAVDDAGNVYVLTRNAPLVIVYDRDGNPIRTWGADFFVYPHAITLGPDGAVWIVDEMDQTVTKYTSDGRKLMTIGHSGQRSNTGVDWNIKDHVARVDSIKGGPPFNGPTALAISSEGDLYVSDGIGNARVHRFSPTGELKASWGAAGGGPLEFRIPHSLCFDSKGRLLITDFENERIQLLSPEGEYIGEWTDVQRPNALAIDADGLIYVSEAPWPAGSYSWRRGTIPEALPCRIAILSPDGERLATVGGGPDRCEPGNFGALHGLAVDADRSIYAADVGYTMWGTLPVGCQSIQKLVRLPGSSF